MLDQRIFSECIQDNAKMAAHICVMAKRQLSDQFDLLLITREDQTGSILLTGFSADDGGSVQVNFAAIHDSLTAIAIERELKKGVRQAPTITQFLSVFANRNFNEKIDTPLLPKEFLNGGSFSDLNMLVTPLLAKPTQLVGLLRLFSTSKIQEKDYDIY